MDKGLRHDRLHLLPLGAAVLGGVLVVGTFVGQGGHADGDTDEDLSTLSVPMAGMSMPGMSTPGMPPVAATPNDAAAPDSVTLRPGSAGTAGGMAVRLVKISHGVATVQMGQNSAALRQGASKTFPDGMSVRAVKVTKDRATLKVTPSW